MTNTTATPALEMHECHSCDNLITSADYVAQAHELDQSLAYHFGARPRCEECEERSHD
jgi:hypothetical protein